MKRIIAIASVTAVALLVTGCAAASGPSQNAVPPRIDHVHGIAADPQSDDLLIATHNGIFTLSPVGEITGPIGGYDFDAMGFTIAGEVLFASGHPGPQTPSELGSPSLGIIRSDDFGASWSPIAFTSTEDFHILTSGPGGTLYGIGSSSPNLLTSTDGGVEWATGTPLAAADIAVTSDALYAATEAGLQRSTDQGKSFALMPSAPLLYTLDAQQDGTLVGADIDGGIWSQNPDGTWEQLGSTTGFAQALASIETDRIVLVDERGIVEVTPDGSTVLRPTG